MKRPHGSEFNTTLETVRTFHVNSLLAPVTYAGRHSCIVAHEHNHIMVDAIRFLICKHLINGHPLATMTADVERPVNAETTPR